MKFHEDFPKFLRDKAPLVFGISFGTSLISIPLAIDKIHSYGFLPIAIMVIGCALSAAMDYIGIKYQK